MSTDNPASDGNRGPAPGVVLHVGTPKCGSTSIQNALSDVLEFHGAGARYIYCRLGKTGRVISGERLQKFARNASTGLATSSGLRNQEPKDVLDPAI